MEKYFILIRYFKQYARGGLKQVVRNTIKKWIKRMALVLICVLLVLGGWAAYRVYFFMQEIYSLDANGETLEPKPPEGSRVNVLLMGIDTYKPEGSRTDVLMLASMDTDTGEAVMLSIPRDTFVDIPGRGGDKINHAHAFGGIPLTVKTVENFLDIEIHYYARINMQGFEDMVDIMGGLEIEVEPEVARAERELESGLQVLNGRQALLYVRERKVSGGDFARIERQQKFLLAFARQSLTLDNVTNLPQFMEELGQNFRTNVPPVEMLRLGHQLLRLDLDTVEREMIRGTGGHRGGVYYLFTEEEEVRSLLRRLNIIE